jgi:hypothetical protein
MEGLTAPLGSGCSFPDFLLPTILILRTHLRSNLQLVSLLSGPTRLRELRHSMDVIITGKDYEKLSLNRLILNLHGLKARDSNGTSFEMGAKMIKRKSKRKKKKKKKRGAVIILFRNVIHRNGTRRKSVYAELKLGCWAFILSLMYQRRCRYSC